MSRKNYTSIKKIINDITIKSGKKLSFEPDDILYLANGIADLILPGDTFVEKIALIDIENYKGKLPSNFKYVSQAVYKEEKEECSECEYITNFSKKIYGSDCEIEVSLKCDPCSNNCGTKIISMDADYNYLLSNPGWAYNHSKFFYTQRNLSKHTNDCILPFEEFKLMRRTTNYFYNIPYHINECINLNADSTVEYNIENGTHIIVNFKKGKVILAYLGAPTDDDGYRMIPDIEEVYDAIYYSIRERLLEQKYDDDLGQNTRIAYQMAEAKAAQKRKRAVAVLSQLEPDEWEMFIRNHWVRTIPQYKWEKTHNRFVGDKTYTRQHSVKQWKNQ